MRNIPCLWPWNYYRYIKENGQFLKLLYLTVSEMYPYYISISTITEIYFQVPREYPVICEFCKDSDIQCICE